MGQGRVNLCKGLCGGSCEACPVVADWSVAFPMASDIVAPHVGHTSSWRKLHVSHAGQRCMCPRICAEQCGHVSAMLDVFCPHPGHLIIGIMCYTISCGRLHGRC